MMNLLTRKDLKHFFFNFCCIKQDLNKNLTPQEVVSYLDQHIIGQGDAKRSVAIAYRNRWRRKQLSDDMKREVYPKNILMVGPSGCGKTEIARRLATLTSAPFIKVEATKYTEVGFHGKDVELMIHDLVRMAVRQRKQSLLDELNSRKQEIDDLAVEYILKILLGPNFQDEIVINEKRQAIIDGSFDDRQIYLELPQTLIDETPMENIDQLFKQLQDYNPGTYPNTQYDRVNISYAKRIICDTIQEKAEQDIDYQKQALQQVEEDGIVFIDEIDKIAVPEGSINHSKSPSADGVQRDLLPLIEGTLIQTKMGDVKTDHILFIASGAFHQAKVTDLIPELLGRLPVRVELKALTSSELERVLIEPKYNLIEQHKQLLLCEGVQVEFDQSAIKELAEAAFEMNMLLENVGARRLHGIVEKVLDEISFNAPQMKGQIQNINAEYVKQKLAPLRQNIDLARFLI